MPPASAIQPMEELPPPSRSSCLATAQPARFTASDARDRGARRLVPRTLFKRWQTLGTRSAAKHDSVDQAACYSLGLFDEDRDVVIATLDTGSRRWNYEVIPEGRVERAWERACRRLDAPADHYEARGPDSDALPERNFAAADWQCRRCPYLNTCHPGTAKR